MRVVLADIKSNRGSLSKDTVVGGYGSRLEPFSKVTRGLAFAKKRFTEIPSVMQAYNAAILAGAGHEICPSSGELLDGDVALVLSSLVDYRNETAWADRMRGRGVKVGFVGIAASKMPRLFSDHCDFILSGEAETGVMRLAGGEIPSGTVVCEQIDELDRLPFPRWDLVTPRAGGIRWVRRSTGHRFPVLASRGCTEYCTYCPHRLLGSYRARSVPNIVDEVEQLCGHVSRPHVAFRDPLFTKTRDRVLELCDEIAARGLRFTFDIETRLDQLDTELLDRLAGVGLKAIGFGVESADKATLRRVGRRAIPEAHQREIIEHCRTLNVTSVAFYVLGFLEDDWDSIAATIDYAIDLRSTYAQFKLLTPYPGTPLFKQIESLIHEENWERFDSFTPTFRHPNLSTEELRFLLGAAYTRFYVRPSFLADLLMIDNKAVREWLCQFDRRVLDRHARVEIDHCSRSVAC
jgi:anaerobic magnesium-protoporphyrin IX monomethyl ester cyclase